MTLTADREAWKTVAQPWELGWWTRPENDAIPEEAKNDVQGMRVSEMICDCLGISREDVEGKNVLDVGCGPTGRLRRLESWKGDGQIWAIDPLAENYRSIRWANLDVYDFLRSVPAEELQTALVRYFHVVISINALDHGYDLLASMRNIRSYLRPGGVAFISFDCTDDPTPDPTHPLRISKEAAEATFIAAGFEIERSFNDPCYPTFGDPPDDLKVVALRQNWGHGVHWHWRLR